MIPFTSTTIKAIVVAVYFAACIGLGWYAGNVWVEAKRAEQLEADIAALEEENTLNFMDAVALEAELAANRAQARTIIIKREKDIAEHHDYRACRPTDGGLQLLHEAYTGGRPAAR